MNFFFPKQVIFFDLLKDMTQETQRIATLFAEFSSNFNNFEVYSKKAKEIEHDADHKAHAIIDWLNKTFITPIDREDIYLLTHELDDIIDLIENVIHNIDLYQLTKKISAIDEFVPIISSAANNLVELVEHLRDLNYTPQFKKMIINIHELEDRGDEIFSKSISKLFREEQDPVFIVKAKDILEDLENVMDKYQRVSDIIESIVVKSS